MEVNRSARTKRNIISGLLNRILTLFLPFVIRTIIIQKLGAEYLGLSGLFTAILQVLNMAELGFSNAVVFSLYKPMAEKNTEEICALMSFYRRVYFVVGFAIAFAGLILLPWLPKLISGSYPSDINIYILYIIYLVNTVISYLAFAYKNVLLSADQHQNILNNIDSILCICRYGIQIVVLLALKNYYAYIIWNLVFTIINNLLVDRITRKKYPEYVCYGNISNEKKKEISKQIKGLAIGKIASVARNSFDSIVLSAFCGLIDVAIYSNYYYIYSAIGGFLSILITSLTGSVGNSIATESVDKNYYDFKRFHHVFCMIVGICTMCFVSLYQPFMRLWVGEGLLAPMMVMILFCIYFYISQLGQVRAMYASAAGIWWEFRFLQIGEMIGNLILNFGLGYLWGMKGILIATIITVFIFSIVGISQITFKTYFKKSTFEFWTDNIIYFLIVILGSFISFKFCENFPENWAYLLVRLVVCIVVGAMINGIMTYSIKKYREYFASVIQNIFK